MQSLHLTALLSRRCHPIGPVHYAAQFLRHRPSERVFCDISEHAEKRPFGLAGVMLTLNQARRGAWSLGTRYIGPTFTSAAPWRRAKAQVSADARGVEGSSVEQLLDDITREGDDTETILQLNRFATARQLNLEASG